MNETPTQIARRICPNWMSPTGDAHYRDVKNALEKQHAENELLRAAVTAAVPCLDTDRDLTDAEVQGTYPALIARRAALRHCQSALANYSLTDRKDARS